MPASKSKSKIPKSEPRSEIKPINVNMVIIEQGKMSEYDLDITDAEEFEMPHNGRTLTFKRDEVLQKTFAQMNWHGGVKQLFAFCRLPNNGEPDLIGLDEFNPYETLSAEEADIMLHEGVTMKGVKNLVTKITGKHNTMRIWLIFGMIIIIAIILVLKSEGMI